MLLEQFGLVHRTWSHNTVRVVGVDDSTMDPLEDGATQTFKSAVMRLGFLALDRPDIQFAAKEAANGVAKPSAHLVPMCSLPDPCSYVDMIVVPTTMARQDRRKRRHGLGQLLLDTTIDIWTHGTDLARRVPVSFSSGDAETKKG